MTQSKVPSALRIISEMCFVFAFLCVITGFGKAYPFYILFMVLCTGAEIAIRAMVRRGLGRALWILVSLVPSLVTIPLMIAIYQGSLVMPMIALVAMSIWFIAFNAAGVFNSEYWRFKRTFTVFLFASVFILLITAIFMFAYVTRVSVAIYTPVMFGFAGAGCLLGFIVLSEMRSGEPDLRWRALNALKIIGIFVVAVLVLVLLFFLLKYVYSFIRPIEDTRKIPKVQYNGDPEHMVIAIQYGSSVAVNDSKEGEPDMEDTTISYLEVVKKEGLRWELIVIIVIAVAVAAFLVYRYVKRRSKAEAEKPEPLPPEEQERLDKVMKIRTAFKEYMDYVRSHGGKVGKGSTSEEIVQSSMESEGESVSLSEQRTEAEKTLREVYIKARYGRASDITEDDVQKAQACLSVIIGEK